MGRQSAGAASGARGPATEAPAARASDRGPEGPEPQVSEGPAGHRGKGCLTAEVAERHGALVPGSPASRPPGHRRSRISMATHGALNGARPGPNKTGSEAPEPCAHAQERRPPGRSGGAEEGGMGSRFRESRGGPTLYAHFADRLLAPVDTF